jgi:hypothetical protein
MLDTRVVSQSFDNLCDLVCAGNASGDTEAINWEPFLPRILPMSVSMSEEKYNN